MASYTGSFETVVDPHQLVAWAVDRQATTRSRHLASESDSPSTRGGWGRERAGRTTALAWAVEELVLTTEIGLPGLIALSDGAMNSVPPAGLRQRRLHFLFASTQARGWGGLGRGGEAPNTSAVQGWSSDWSFSPPPQPSPPTAVAWTTTNHGSVGVQRRRGGGS